MLSVPSNVTVNRIAIAFLVAVVATSGTATAQGRGRGVGQAGSGSPARSGGQPSPAPGALQSSSAFPQYGTWLDDATTVGAGTGYVSVATSYWQEASANQLNAPILSATYGISTRAQLSATVPFYRLRYDGYSGGGIETVYVNAKFALITPDGSTGRFGMAFGGVTEILSSGSTEGSRVHWAVPLSVEFRAPAVRMYGSTGYFSRGAFFAAGAFEWTVPTGTSLTGSFSHSQSVRGVTTATMTTVEGTALSEANIFVSQPISKTTSVYVAAGRTLSTARVLEATSVGGGFSFRFAGS
jgi:hypothetical protein